MFLLTNLRRRREKFGCFSKKVSKNGVFGAEGAEIFFKFQKVEGGGLDHLKFLKGGVWERVRGGPWEGVRGGTEASGDLMHMYGAGNNVSNF